MGAAEAREALVVDRYAVFDEIASGGMATVHLGRLLGAVGFTRTVAIKRLHPQFAKDPEFASMFLDEARLAARIRHPNVVPTLDVVSTGTELLIVMEYVQGEPLSRLWRAVRPGTVPARIVATIMTGVLHGLHAAHEARTEHGEPLEIVHRDVSPQNVLVGVDGVPRVLDFGVAKAAHRVQTTRGGQIKGKLSYMAPEQLMNETVDRRADIYAAAVVLWESLTGQRLFEGATDARVLKKILDAKVDPPSKLVPGLPRALDELTLKGLSADPKERFSTAREMAVALEQAIPGAPMSEIGAWVESLAGAALIERAKRVAEIESRSDIYVATPPRGSSPQIPAAPPSGSAAGAPPVSHREPPTAPEATRVALVAERTPAPAERPSAKTPAAERKRPGVLWFALLVLVAAAGTVLGVCGWGLWEPPGSSRAAATGDRPGPTAETAAATATMSATAAATATATATTLPGATATPTTTSAATATSATAAATAAKATAAAKVVPAAPPKRVEPSAKCNPPYTVDAAGIRHVKPECM